VGAAAASVACGGQRQAGLAALGRQHSGGSGGAEGSVQQQQQRAEGRGQRAEGRQDSGVECVQTAMAVMAASAEQTGERHD
jgi:hypothetical protein